MALMKKLSRREDETQVIDAQIEELKSQISLRSDISKEQNIVNEKSSNFKRKSAIGNRQLAEIAKNQQLEIQFLQNELERLRQRSFPLFAKPRSESR